MTYKLSKIAENMDIINSNRFRNEIVEEYKEVLESLDSIDKSIINKNIEMLPVYKINEGLISKAREIIKSYNKRKEEKEWRISAKNKNIDALKKPVTPYKLIKVHSKSDMDKFYKNNDFCIECAPVNKEFPQIAVNLLAANFDINTPVNVYEFSGKDFNKIYDLYGNNAYQDNIRFIVIPLDTIKNNKDIVNAKYTIKSRYFNDIVDNNEYREYLAGRHKKSPQIQWLIDQLGDRDEIEEAFYDIDSDILKNQQPVNEALNTDYNFVMSYNINFVQRKLYPLWALRKTRDSFNKRLVKYETQLKNFKKMSEEEKEKLCFKINAANSVYSAGIAVATTAASSYASNGQYSLTYIEIPSKITPFNYESVVSRMIKKMKYDINKLEDIIDKKEKAKGLKESYIIDLDSLKYVVESEQCTLEEAIQKIKDVNYIGDTYEIYCLLPDGFNEQMTLNQFITLHDTLTEAGINLVWTKEVAENEFVNELSRQDWKDVGKKYKYTDRFRFNTVFKNFADIMKNMLDNPQKSGNFETIRPRLLKLVDRCKTIDEVNYLRRDLNAGVVQLTKLKQNRPEISDGIDRHIKWLKTEYREALNNKAKELKSKK